MRCGQPALDRVQPGDDLALATVLELDLHLAAGAFEGDQLGMEIRQFVDQRHP